jgi:glycosyltransferase involved in cell wall biosynthesis
LITTKNRKDELRTAIQSTLAQSIRGQILVLDDGSTDGTSEMVRAEFPSVTLHREETSLGIIRARNKGVELAQTEIVVTIDDDCTFSAPDILSQTLHDLSQPQVAIVTMPIINVKQSNVVSGRAKDDQSIWISSHFQGGANAVKRSIFLRTGGLRAAFYRQCEETDMTLRLLDRGYVTRSGRAAPVLHFESPVRDKSKIYFFSARNNLLLLVINVPFPMLLLHLAATAFNLLMAGWRNGYTASTLSGCVAFLAKLPMALSERRPVQRKTYHLFRRIKKSETLRLETTDGLLPPIHA